MYVTCTKRSIWISLQSNVPFHKVMGPTVTFSKKTPQGKNTCFHPNGDVWHVLTLSKPVQKPSKNNTAQASETVGSFRWSPPVAARRNRWSDASTSASSSSEVEGSSSSTKSLVSVSSQKGTWCARYHTWALAPHQGRPAQPCTPLPAGPVQALVAAGQARAPTPNYQRPWSPTSRTIDWMMWVHQCAAAAADCSSHS